MVTEDQSWHPKELTELLTLCCTHNEEWCRWSDSNRHDFLRSQDFKSCASAISPHRHVFNCSCRLYSGPRLTPQSFSQAALVRRERNRLTQAVVEGTGPS